VCFIDDTSLGLLMYDLFVDSCFLIDIVLTFFTVIKLPGGKYINDLSVLAKTYVSSGWFFIDLFTSIPFQLIEGHNDGGLPSDTSVEQAKVLKLARLPRLYRLVRIIRLMKVLRLAKTRNMDIQPKKMRIFNNNMKSLLKMMGTVIFITHLMTCLWFFQAKLLDFPADSWVMIGDFMEESIARTYMASFYWAF